MKSLRHIAVWLLMLILPLQAVAAYAPAAAACGDQHAAAMHQTEADHSGHHAMAAAADHGQQSANEHQHHDSSPSNDFDGHSCCHQVLTGAASVALPFAPESPRVILQRVSLLNTLFIPELPQRPPRA
jgi:hypothetical protein